MVNSTLFIALYGAVVSTVALIWGIHRDASNRGHLRLRCYIAETCSSKSLSTRSVPMLAFDIVNPGSKPIMLAQIGISCSDGRQGIVGTRVPLPKLIAPQERIIEYAADLVVLDQNPKSLWVMDSVGKKYRLSRRHLKRLVEGNREPSTTVIEQI